ncbi:tRNA (guanosine(46)-N7)-methyltransferase TrmB [Filimonas effusa]|uniref:tRNA (guanine-N(7)-)-methyltransferase n=1 Tax=Filimonas effusa TaxID=2508721 RepID=A0A4Q1CZX2_9BACT|nr:tRNA (guanosine(46)-N7)-methyltransferase TrmB [Filimonas effusa]RXK80970.1 tRNA (guanosine(46)-N7)-methyltransferase TrmB [Filimonas effusa]
MGQKKLIRFEEIKSFPNVLEYPENVKGTWHHFFKNDNPLTLELACGKGEYAVGLGRLYPNRNFIGIDVKGNRIWRGAKTALTEGLGNVAFVRSQMDKVTEYFVAGEVDEIWITFPDPQLRFSKMKKRLTHPKYLRLYQEFLKPGGIVQLKTDSPVLYEFTKTVIGLYELELLTDDNDVYRNGNYTTELQIKTHYESLDIAQSNRVHYLKFRLNKSMPKEKDAILKEMLNEEPANEK